MLSGGKAYCEKMPIFQLYKGKKQIITETTVEVGGKQFVTSSDSVSAINDKYFIGEGG